MKSLRHYYNVVHRRLVHSLIIDNKPVAYFLSKHCLKVYLAAFYENWVGKRMNYRHPEDLNQALIKLSWQNSRNPHMREAIPRCVDKYAVRDFIKDKGYAETLNELFGVYDNVNDIVIDSLPDQFVMKMTNASGRNFICTDKNKCDWGQVKAMFEKWQTDTEFGWQTGEWQYALIQPRIIIERYMKDLGDVSLVDYKFQCIKGQAVDVFVCYNRENNVDDKHYTGGVCYDCYDLFWRRTEDIKPERHKNRMMIPRPANFEPMIKMAEECSKDFPYCRFDLYEIDGRIVFGEMTFTPNGNVMDFYKDEYLLRNKGLLT